MEKIVVIGYNKNEFYNEIQILKKSITPYHISNNILSDKINLLHEYESKDIINLLTQINKKNIEAPYGWILAIEKIYENNGFEFIRSSFTYTEKEAISNGFTGNAIIIYNNSSTSYEFVLKIFKSALSLNTVESALLTRVIHEKGSVLIPIGSVYRGNIILEKIKNLVKEEQEKNLHFELKSFKNEIYKSGKSNNSSTVNYNITLSISSFFNKDLLLYFIMSSLMFISVYLIYYDYTNDYTVYNYGLYEATKYLWGISYFSKFGAVIVALLESMIYIFLSIGIAITNNFDLSTNIKDLIYFLNFLLMIPIFALMQVLEAREQSRATEFIIDSKVVRHSNLYAQWSPPKEIGEKKTEFKRYLRGVAPDNSDLRLRFSQLCLFHTKLMNNSGLIHRIDFLFDETNHRYDFKYISIINSIHHQLILNILLMNNVEFNKDSNMELLVRLLKKNNIISLSKSSIKAIKWFSLPCDRKGKDVKFKVTNKVLSKPAILTIILLSEYIWGHDESGFNRPLLLNITT